MADLTVTNTHIAANNTQYEPTGNVATVDDADATQKFIITPTKGEEKTLIRITVAAVHGTVTFSVAAGPFWMGIAAKTGSVAQAKTSVLQLETAKYLQSNGTIEITFTPASGKKLKSEHVLTVEVDQLF